MGQIVGFPRQAAAARTTINWPTSASCNESSTTKFSGSNLGDKLQHLAQISPQHVYGIIALVDALLAELTK